MDLGSLPDAQKRREGCEFSGRKGSAGLEARCGADRSSRESAASEAFRKDWRERWRKEPLWGIERAWAASLYRCVPPDQSICGGLKVKGY